MNHIAIHEAGHAVVGISLGRGGLLKKVSIVETETTFGGCHWNLDEIDPTAEATRGVAIGFAGPIAEVLLMPDASSCNYVPFRTSILQPDEIILESGCEGWLTTDLRHYRQSWVLTTKKPFENIERIVRELISRPSVAAAIRDLAALLDAKHEIDGHVVDWVVKTHFNSGDFLGNECFNECDCRVV